MKTINVDLSTGEALNLYVGQQGENAVTQVIFDFSALKTEFGSGTLSLSVQRPKEYTPYAQTLTVSGTDATWLVNETDTGVSGCGQIQLTYTVNSKVAKTVVYKYTVLHSIGADGEYPIPGQTWQEEMEDEIADIKEDLANIDSSGVPSNVRTALYNLLNAAAYASTGHTSDISTIQSWASSVTAISLNQSTASITGTDTVQLVATTTPSGGAVSWSSSDTSIATVSSSGLVTGVNNGSVTITASSGGHSATCTVTVSGNATLSSISAVYTQSGTVYDTDSLDSLKTDLVVTAHYSDSSTSTVASSAYTLSGTLTVGTSTITVSYGGKTTTFTVTVSADVSYVQSGLIHRWDGENNTLNGHNSSATTWYDLVGTYDLVMNNSSLSTWDSNALSFPGTVGQFLKTTDNVETLTSITRTVEVCFAPASSQTSAIVLPFKGARVGKIGIFTDNTFCVNGTSGKTYLSGESAITDLNHVAVTIDSSGNVVDVYANGVAATLGNTTHSLSDTSNYMVVGQTKEGSSGSVYPFNGKIYSIRIYDRNLSASEIADNYAVDVARFLGD